MIYFLTFLACILFVAWLEDCLDRRAQAKKRIRERLPRRVG
jgi:hypothetical protein